MVRVVDRLVVAHPSSGRGVRRPIASTGQYKVRIVERCRRKSARDRNSRAGVPIRALSMRILRRRPTMVDDKKGKETLEADGGDHAQVDRDDGIRMVRSKVRPLCEAVLGV